MNEEHFNLLSLLSVCNEEHLNLLSICHYVFGSVIVLFSCLPLLCVAMGVAMLWGAIEDDTPPVAWAFILFGAVFTLVGWMPSAVMIVAGRKLKRRTSRTFCMVAAGLECILMPFGTVLGVFTLVVLMKESVAKLFAANNGVHSISEGRANAYSSNE